MPQHTPLHSAMNSALHGDMSLGLPMFVDEGVLFSAISPSADGTIGVEPLKGEGSATFARSGVVAHVRDFENVYRLVAANEARLQGARRVAGVYYWKLGDGTPLHPVIRKEGVNVFARYNERADSTSYVVGDNMIPASGSGPAGGNGYWYQVTAITTGTSGGSPPTFPETIGNTVVDGGITLTNMGHYKIAGYHGEPAGINSILQSRQFDTTWAQVNNPTEAQDQVGIDGVANTAWTLGDDDAALAEYYNQSVVISNDGNTHTASLYILKDSDTTRFPHLTFQFSGGTALSHADHINTQTGEITGVSGSQDGTSTIEDHGLWWRWVVSLTNNSTGNTSGIMFIFPARASIAGTVDNAVTGTTVFDQAQLELNTSIPSSPIITTTVAVTRNTESNYPRYDLANVLDSAGTVFFSWLPQYDDSLLDTNKTLISLNGAAGFVYTVTTPNRIRSYDATTVANSGTIDLDASAAITIAVRWNAATSKYQVIVNGVAGIEVAYDGAFSRSSYISLLVALIKGSVISDIRIYGKDLGQTLLESLTDYD